MTSSGTSEYPRCGRRRVMSLAIGRTPVHVVRRPAPLVKEDADQRLKIAVLFTSVESTLAALKGAGELASHLGAQITLVVPQVVPYPLPLQCPPVSPEFSARRFRVIASKSPVETRVQICLCRDPM